jgi:Ca2+-binding EF-hand superfamily protein
MNIINITKLKIYSNHTKPYKYFMYLNNNEISRLCIYTKFNKINIHELENIFYSYQNNGMICKSYIVKMIKFPNKTQFYKNMFIYFDIQYEVDIIHFILLCSIMYNKANFITTEKIIFDIIDIENNGIITIPLLKSTLLTNDDNYNIITLYNVTIENEEFCISLQLLVDIMIQELFINTTYLTYDIYLIHFNTTPYRNIILYMFTNNLSAVLS